MGCASEADMVPPYGPRSTVVVTRQAGLDQAGPAGQEVVGEVVVAVEGAGDHRAGAHHHQLLGRRPWRPVAQLLEEVLDPSGDPAADLTRVNPRGVGAGELSGGVDEGAATRHPGEVVAGQGHRELV